MGSVYEAEQEVPHRTVALKLIRAGYADAEMLRRFDAETQALGRLQHPGIAQVYDAGTAETSYGHQPYIAMELVHGQALLAYCGQRRLNVRQRLELFAKICDAVQHAHQRGLIHRDLKPANILVTDDGQPKILDFGVARLTDSDAQATRQTSIGQIIGTLAYMSPEQIAGDPAQLDTRSDVYTLGVILYEMLAGRPPYEIGKQIHEAISAIREKEASALGTINRAFRGDVETIVAKALEKDKTRRYGSAAELAADIRHNLRDEPIVARRASSTYQIKKFARRNKILVSGIAAVFIVLVLGVIASTWEAVQAHRAQKSAQQEAAIAQAVNDFLQKDLLGQASAYSQTKPDPNVTVRTILDRAAQNIGSKFGSQPEVEAAIRDTIGNAYQGLGLYPESQRQLETALALSRRSLGGNNAKTLDIMSDLGLVAADGGNYKEAEQLLASAVAGDRRVLGTGNAQTLRAMNRLGVVFEDEGRYKQAESVLRETVETRSRVLGEHHPDTAGAMHNLATAYLLEGKYAQAAAMEKEILDTYRLALGPDNPRTLIAMTALATCYLDEGHYFEAESLERQALDGDRRILGPEHPGTLNEMTNMAVIYEAESRYDQAEALFRQTLSLQRRILGAENPQTLVTMNSLAADYQYEGKYAQEAMLDRQVLDLRTRVLGPEHPLTLVSMNNAASAYEVEGNFAEARSLYAKAEGIDRRVLGARSLYTVLAMANIGGVDTELGRYVQAESEIKAALDEIRSIEGTGTYALMMQHQLAAAESGQGQLAEAEDLYRKTYDAERRTLGAENQETIQTLSGLGATYLLEKRYQQAQNCAAQALASLRHNVGAKSVLTANAEADLSLAYLSGGKFLEAASIAREALAIEAKAEPDNWQRYRAESLLGESLAGQKNFAEGAPLLRDGYQGMLSRKDHIDASDQYQLTLASQWLLEFHRAAGKPTQISEQQ